MEQFEVEITGFLYVRAKSTEHAVKQAIQWQDAVNEWKDLEKLDRELEIDSVQLSVGDAVEQTKS
jgi:hypothetical protein